MKGVKIPIELEPPPTQAITRAGRPPSAASACSRDSSPITLCRSRTRAGKGRRADRRADHVVGAVDVRDPVADRLADRLLQRAGAGLDRDHLGAQQPHPLDVRLLAANVLAAHVDDALQAEQRAGRRRRHAVLAGAGLGDDPRLAHPPGEQRLADRVVDLVGARVGEVLALQVDPAVRLLGEALGKVERRRPADEVAVQERELLLEPLVLARLRPGLGELVERRDQRLRHVAAPVGAEPILHLGAHDAGTPVAFAASKKAAIVAWSLRPGSASTPLATSTA